jgi:hypothetical protein
MVIRDLKNQRIEVITYGLEDSRPWEHLPPKPVDSPEFSGIIQEGELYLVPKVHFATLDEAIDHADAFILAYEARAAVTAGHLPFKFRFKTARASGDSPDTNDPTLLVVAPMPDVVVHEIRVIPSPDEYPEPPPVSHADADAVAISGHYRRYREGKAELIPTAYACLSLLCASGRRKDAAIRCSIDVGILNRLGELSTERGDRDEARKWSETNVDLSPNEKAWILAALKAIVNHLLIRTPGKQLTLGDIPGPKP